MRFIIDQRVFEKLPHYVVGVVVARSIDTSRHTHAPEESLRSGESLFRDRHSLLDYKEHPDLQPYREAFEAVGINPNRFPSSIEAMGKRVLNGASLPQIHPVIDLVNGISLSNAVPMGAHDLDQLGGDFEVRFSGEGETFVALGSNEQEVLPSGELIYGDASRVRTRRWMWRQSEWGKVTSTSKNVLFPADGFANTNLDKVLAARDQLAAVLAGQFGALVSVYLMDRDHPVIQV
jgi:DNA/RNA-binding domain of Phe-tRNA-synthetase-like protein